MAIDIENSVSMATASNPSPANARSAGDFRIGHQTGARVMRFFAKLGLGLITAALWSSSLPEPDLGWIGWVALVPLIIACHNISPLAAAAVGFVSGLGTAYGMLHWIFEVPGFGLQHSLLAASYLALYPACWCAGVSLMSRACIMTAFPAAALWVLLDYVRAHAGFLAFSWGTLAHTQHRNLPLLQLATITGEYGVTFMVVFGSVALAGIIVQRAWRAAAFAAIVVALAHIGGAFALQAAARGTMVRLAAVQPNIQRGEQATPEGRIAIFERLERLTHAAAAQHPSLIAWPETAIAGNLQANPLLAADLQGLAQETGTPIVLGVSEVEKFASRDPTGTSRRRTYNSAYLVSPGEQLPPPYRKRVLLPFGEYVPLETIVPWPEWMSGKGFDSEAGGPFRLFTLPDGTSFATMICWESLFSDLSRESVQAGARLLVQLNNPAWFGHSAAAKQQNISSVLRAAENRVPVLLSSNTGPSQIIDRYGRVIARTSESFATGIAAGEVELGTGGTPYTQVGDCFVLGLFSALIIGVIRHVTIKPTASVVTLRTRRNVMQTRSNSMEEICT